MTQAATPTDPSPATGSGFPPVMRVVGAVVAPATLVTSILFYFGYMHAHHFFHYFGVNSTLLGLSTTDLVMRSVDALFVPMVVFAVTGLALAWAHTAVRSRLTRARLPWLPRLVYVQAAIALVLVVGGLVSVFTRTVLTRWVGLAPLCLGGGALLLLYTVRLRRALPATTSASATKRANPPTPPRPWVPVAEVAAVFVLVALSLFWAATDYSSAVGRSQGRLFADSLPRQPDAVVYSERSLRLEGPGVRELRCPDPDSAYQFRYDGLKLIVQSGGQYVLLPEGWSRAGGVAYVIPRTDTLRVEFHPAAATGNPPATC